jgi:hypothetical protein
MTTGSTAVDIEHVARVDERGTKYDAVCTCTWRWTGWPTFDAALRVSEIHLTLAASGAFLAEQPLDTAGGTGR